MANYKRTVNYNTVMEQRSDSADARKPATDIFKADSDIDDKHDERQQNCNQTFQKEFLTRRGRYVRGFDKLYPVCGILFRKGICKLKLLVGSQTAV